MCISSARADFKGTNILFNLVDHAKLGVRAVIGYQNKPQNLSKGPNAMLLHFPAKKMGKSNFISSAGSSKIFDDFRNAIRPPSDFVSKGMGRAMRSAVEVFRHGAYTVVLASDPTQIPAALQEVEKDKRPFIAAELMDFYAQKYAGWPVALCCFNNSDPLAADPLFVQYEPLRSDVFLLPALDAHTGGPPDLNERVDVDHYLFFGDYRATHGDTVHYSRALAPELLPFLPRKVTGHKFRGTLINGDFGITNEASANGVEMVDIARYWPDFRPAGTQASSAAPAVNSPGRMQVKFRRPVSDALPQRRPGQVLGQPETLDQMMERLQSDSMR